MNVYEIVTEKIMEKLKEGTIPWRKPWTGGVAKSWNTQKPYRGINTMLLMPGEYITFKQIKKAGGKIKKGTKSEIVVFWKWLEKETDEGENEKIPMLRYYRVFNINDCEGIKSRDKNAETFDHDPIEEAEQVISNYPNGPNVQWRDLQAYYRPSMDIVNMPPLKHFYEVNKYYSTFFHELVHSTGHKKRLNRSTMTQPAAFGTETYSKEELVAEMGAAMLCGHTGIDNSTLDQSAAYVDNWLHALKGDSRLVVQAAAQAQKAADHILDIKWEQGE